MQFMLTTVLSFAGLGVALAVIVLNVVYLIRSAHKLSPLLYIGISLFYGYMLITNLIRQSSGLVCAITPARTLFTYGGLVLLHLWFLRDTWKCLLMVWK